jgi:hypothetical protein
MITAHDLWVLLGVALGALVGLAGLIALMVWVLSHISWRA